VLVTLGFIKPVGQQHVKVKSRKGEEVLVDKDVELIKEHFHLDHLDYESMSPIIIPGGYTKDYVDGKITFESQVKELESAMHSISEVSDVTVCEGTGHCAVGSIVGLNNAKVASILGADMVRATLLRSSYSITCHVLTQMGISVAVNCQWRVG
jgi:AAA domain